MVRVFHLTKQYTRDQRALSDVSLNVDKGEFCFLTGPSGAGKSTLLKLLFGAERPSSGQVFVADHAVHRLTERSLPYLRRNIGVVFQDFKLLRRSVFENVAFVLEVLGHRRSEIHRRVAHVLHALGLGDKLHVRADRLSGGEQQRVAVARALASEPMLLLADEPTGNLDPEAGRAVLELLRQANARGTTVMVATHDPHLLGARGARRVELRDGRLVDDGRR